MTIDMVRIEKLELSIRAYNCLKRAGIHTIGDLKATDDEKLKHIRNLGARSIREIKDKLAELEDPDYVQRLLDEEAREHEDYDDILLPDGLDENDIMEALCQFDEDGDDPEPVDYMAKLDELIGLDDVKSQVRRIAAFARMQKDLSSRGMKKIPVVLNMEFAGNPGTAKTTVARLLAGILHETGILKYKDIVEVGRADLVAKYVGQTADQVKDIFVKAEGRLLFIDEAYTLVDGYEKSFGDEAISTIVQEMENRRDKVVVVFAGYPDEMKEFFSRNPGLRSRVPFTLRFKDYSAEELVRIAEKEAADRGFSIDGQAKSKLYAVCRTAAGIPEKGNGRFCRNLIENAVLEYAARVYSGESEADICGNDLVLTGDDFRVSETLKQPERRLIGFTA